MNYIVIPYNPYSNSMSAEQFELGMKNVNEPHCKY